MQSEPKVLIPRDDLLQIVGRLAQELRHDYLDRNPLIIGILKGSFVFLADLIRLMEVPVEVDFARLSSYGPDTTSSGRVRMIHGVRTPLAGRDVIIVEDIVDTGLSLDRFTRYVRRRKPASVRTCALLDKPSRRKVDLVVDYLGITIPDRFVVGYGLDCNEGYRHLPDLCVFEE